VYVCLCLPDWISIYIYRSVVNQSEVQAVLLISYKKSVPDLIALNGLTLATSQLHRRTFNLSTYVVGYKPLAG
jgi:hypothetical protein